MRKVVHSRTLMFRDNEKVYKYVYNKLDLLKKRKDTGKTLDRDGTLLVSGRTLHHLSHYLSVGL